jgi:hypothetical protein
MYYLNRRQLCHYVSTRRRYTKCFIFDSKQMTKFEILGLASLELAAFISYEAPSFSGNIVTDGRRIESSSKRKNPLQVWRRLSRAKIK